MLNSAHPKGYSFSSNEQGAITNLVAQLTGGLAAAPATGQLDTAILEVDGLIKVSVIVTTKPTITGGDLFIDYIDCHYQSTNLGTAGKAPNFYA
jgi:hypothetical protein